MARCLWRAALPVALAAVLVAFVAPAQAATAPDIPHAISYLESQQGQNGAAAGAWDQFPAFEFATTEAILATAESAQTTGTWNTAAALAAVQGLSGGNPLAFIDQVASGSLSAGKAGKLVLLVAKPLGLSPTAFDPNNDGSPVNLDAAIGAPDVDGKFAPDGFFNSTLDAALGRYLLDGSLPTSVRDYVESKQQPGGGWAFDSTTTTDPDIDTTGTALEVLIATGVAPTDSHIVNGLRYLAGLQRTDGTWPGFFNDPSPESSSRAMIAITAAGYDVNSSCWRDTVVPADAGKPYAAPDGALAALQAPDGSILGPNTFSGPFTTAQAVQGVERSWLPVARAATQTCVAGEVVTAPAAAAVAAEPAFTG